MGDAVKINAFAVPADVAAIHMGHGSFHHSHDTEFDAQMALLPGCGRSVALVCDQRALEREIQQADLKVTSEYRPVCGRMQR